MSWYYAGPEAKPVGPVSLEDLQARRLRGEIGAETYVIEHTGEQGTVGAWRRYREIFPTVAQPPSLPPLPAMSSPVFPPPLAGPSIPAPSPLFPSAGATPPPPPVYTPTITPHAAPHGHYPVRKTNGCCAWGFALALAGCVLSAACGVGMMLAVPGLILCLIGLAQTLQNPGQSGRGLAVTGTVLALLALLISISLLAYFGPMAVREMENEGKQQSSE